MFSSTWSRFWEWNLVHRTHSPLLLENFALPLLQAAPPSQAKAGQKCFKLQVFLSKSLSNDPPHTQTNKYTDIKNPPNYNICQDVLVSVFLFCFLSSNSEFRTLWLKYIHWGKKNTHSDFVFPLVLMTQIYSNVEDNKTEPQRQLFPTPNFF